MTNWQAQSSALLCFTQLFLPALFIYWMGFVANCSKLRFAVKFVLVWTYFVCIFYVGLWGFIPYLLRYGWPVLLLAATARGSRGFGALAPVQRKSWWAWASLGAQAGLAGVLLAACGAVLRGFSAPEPGIDVAFPLRAGFIGHGGNATVINYHHADSTAQQYALDISRLNGWGLRATGFFPTDLRQYTIYGDTLFSPCDGKVVVAKDGLDNMPPGTQDRVNLAGNHFVIEYHHSLLVFAHLLKHSLWVSRGDSVHRGQPLARVGNSGHTTEPRLHVHAIAGTDTSKIIRGGNGIPIYFGGRFLVRNDQMKK